MSEKRAIIIGAGPAGLTAALELIERTDIKPVIFEASQAIGGISKTVNYKGNRIDIGGHRFFSKSDRVMAWWAKIMPISADAGDGGAATVTYRSRTREVTADPAVGSSELVMLLRRRLSRIFFLRRFFDYPISMNVQTALNLGPVRIVRILLSYLATRLNPIRDERSLEDFFINRFGRELYLTFFKDYTEKVWGVPCNQIKPEWGAQRIKGLSLTKTAVHAVRSLLMPRPAHAGDIAQKGVETSLIERFLYPKYGPGQMWEEVARRVQAGGGELHLGWTCTGVELHEGRVINVTLTDAQGRHRQENGDVFFSTMPVQELVAAMQPTPPANVREVARGLIYRDFITVGLLLKRLKIKNTTGIPTERGLVPDTWIYVQERDVRIGRLQIFNNWSPFMVKDPDTVWIGLEYFCNQGDDLWSMPDAEFVRFAIAELAKIDIIDTQDVLDSTILRVEKTYPAYFGTYDRFDEIRAFVDTLPNLFLVGRNGMHRYNNSDHSMLTAMTAVDNIVAGVTRKDNIWAVNIEQEYHEEKSADVTSRPVPATT